MTFLQRNVTLPRTILFGVDSLKAIGSPTERGHFNAHRSDSFALGIATAKDLLNRYLAGELLDLRSSVKQLLFVPDSQSECVGRGRVDDELD